jgi:hypothetical protein
MEPYYVDLQTSFAQMSLYDIFHTNDKIVAKLHARRSETSDRAALRAAQLIQTFILAHNFEHSDPKVANLERYYQGRILQPILEVLGNVFTLLHDENPLNLVYVTHCSHDF